MRLYKYVHPDRIDVLVNARIRFSQPPALNDPFDLRPVLVGIFDKDFIAGLLDSEEYSVEAERTFIEKIREHALYANSREEDLKDYFRQAQPLLKDFSREFIDTVGGQFVKTISEALSDFLLNQLGILCLSETPDNDLMWSHYADSHRGFVIEFDGTHPFFDRRKTDRDDLRLLQKVIYNEARPALTVMQLNSVDIFLAKGIKWSYEREWRIIVPLSDADMHITCNPHDVYLFNIPRGAITGVILGSDISPELEGQILEALDGSTEYRNVEVSEAVLSEQGYEITTVPVFRYSPDSLRALLNRLYPAQQPISLEEYRDLLVDLYMMDIYSIDAVEMLLTRYSPMVLDKGWNRRLREDPFNNGIESPSCEGNEDEFARRSHADIVREILKLDSGAKWEMYTKVKDARQRAQASDIPEEPMQTVIQTLPVKEFSELTKNMLPKLLGLTPEQIEELEKKMSKRNEESEQ